MPITKTVKTNKRRARTGGSMGANVHISDSAEITVVEYVSDVDGSHYIAVKVDDWPADVTIFFETTDQLQKFADAATKYLRHNKIERVED